MNSASNEHSTWSVHTIILGLKGEQNTRIPQICPNYKSTINPENCSFLNWFFSIMCRIKFHSQWAIILRQRNIKFPQIYPNLKFWPLILKIIFLLIFFLPLCVELNFASNEHLTRALHTIILSQVVLGGCGILNSVLVFSHPKTFGLGIAFGAEIHKNRKSQRNPHFIGWSAHKPLLFTSSRLPLATLDGEVSSKKKCVVWF